MQKELINLEGLENIEISEEQANTLAFAISSQTIKKFIEENEDEYKYGLYGKYFARLNREYNWLNDEFISKMCKSIRKLQNEFKTSVKN